jgi:hypothetical protein
MEENGQFHSPAAPPPGKSFRYPFDRKLCESQSRARRGGEEKKNPCPFRESNPRSPASSLVTILTVMNFFTNQIIII